MEKSGGGIEDVVGVVAMLRLRLQLMRLLMRLLMLVDLAVLGLWLLGHGGRRGTHELGRGADSCVKVEVLSEKSIRVRKGRCLGSKRRRSAHELRGQIEPGVAEVKAFAERGHVVLGGRHVLEEGAQEFGVRLGKERRTGRIRGIEEAILVLVHRVCEESMAC